ncbi:uncharacterized protein LOC132277518 [Cornus florida]|uniref:uncharacterized protein LOC132277518 n=1 Tax=Cornus florida TaxID=4283 RepID=UPI0028974E74|nr:uncharacterized protein LOC132277518 [Cornus florida]
MRKLKMEELFHNQFYRTETEPTLAGLSKLSQFPRESVKTFIATFRRKRFERVPFRDIYDLAEKATRYELVLKKEKERKNSSKGFDKTKAFTSDTQPSTSSARKGIADIGKVYTFYMAKTEQSFDHLLDDKQIILPKGHNILSATDLKGKEFFKFHNSWNHTTNNCHVFRNVLHKAIDEGVLKFPKKKLEVMGVDGDPFPNIVNTNVISLATGKATDNGKQERLQRVLDSSPSACSDE